jgi:hypothetical protein
MTEQRTPTSQEPASHGMWQQPRLRVTTSYPVVVPDAVHFADLTVDIYDPAAEVTSQLIREVVVAAASAGRAPVPPMPHAVMFDVPCAPGPVPDAMRFYFNRTVRA